MNVRVYQINPDRDKNRVMYERLDDLARYQGSSKVDESLYDRVLRADVDCDNLEQLYTMLNLSGHPLHHGGQMKVSDVVVTDEGAFYCDRLGFVEIGFDESKAQIPEGMMRVLYVEPGKVPYETEIPNCLEAGQQAVKGLIDLVYLGHGAILVCNDEGKLIGMDGNRVLDNGTIIAGPFFITGDGGENFCSLSDAQTEYFTQRFQEPEVISQEDVQADTGFIFYSF
ncbi:MAG: DUF3846 domain-containing protein [Faecousia sp.]